MALRPTSSRRRTVSPSSGTTSARVSGCPPSGHPHAGAALPRPTAHGGDLGRPHRCDEEGAHGPTRALELERHADLPARLGGAESVQCRRVERDVQGRSRRRARLSRGCDPLLAKIACAESGPIWTRPVTDRYRQSEQCPITSSACELGYAVGRIYVTWHRTRRARFALSVAPGGE
jgi:hypothetical protein